jgi:hypothetical protein
MSLLPNATISMSAALVFHTWPLANGRRLLVLIFTWPLDGGMSDFVQCGSVGGLARRLAGVICGQAVARLQSLT